MKDVKEKELFDLFMNTSNNYLLYTRIQNFINEIIKDVKGEENCEFYIKLTDIANNINNTGFEERKSALLDKIFNWSNEISNYYEDYLP